MAKSKNNILSEIYLPDCPISASGGLVLDHEYNDFDAQAERLVGHDQTYMQLTPGPFKGRFVSCFLGNGVSIHIEHCSQALEQTLTTPKNAFSIGVLLGDSAAFRSNGQVFSKDDVMVVPPGGDLLMYSPVGGAVLALVIETDHLFSHDGLLPKARDWLCDLHPHIGMLPAPELAERIRQDAKQTIENMSAVGEIVNLDGFLGRALLSSFVAKLSLEWSALSRKSTENRQNSFNHFMAARTLIHHNSDQEISINQLSKTANLKPRTMQLTYHRELGVSPLSYLRLVRLHLSKKALIDPAQLDQSIGDIAATCGFWNWSRFTQQYRAHFGELPSETRNRI